MQTNQLTAYHAKYLAYALTYRRPLGSMQKLASTLANAQVDLNPHQVQAALFAFGSPLSKGVILADEVGLGKTIEACLVIAQKWAEGKRKILVITPSNLRKQWSQELQDKFFLSSVILEAKSFNKFIKKDTDNPFEQPQIIICSYQFVHTKEQYIKDVDWDLVVLDEAHRLRNVYKENNKIAKSVKDALTDAPKILLTATPLQNTLLELYGLVSIIDDCFFGNKESFKEKYIRTDNPIEPLSELKERLKPICQRTLRRQVLEYIRYTNRIAIVEKYYPTAQEQQLYNLVSDYLQGDQLYALPPKQRNFMSLILWRLLASSTFAVSHNIEALANRLESIIKDSKTKQTADVLATDFEIYDELKDEWDEPDQNLNEKQNYTQEDFEKIKDEIKKLRNIEKLAKAITTNAKGEKLITALEKGFQEMSRLGAAQKAIIFTESLRTQSYLKKILEANGYAQKIVLFNGTNTDKESKKIYKQWLEKNQHTHKITGSQTADMRAALVDYFCQQATIMIATEAAAEGINLQFCSLIINYDMPWNPQRIEQRIGRCHRYGQKHDVVVVNFLNKANQADLRVYELLDQKFQLFNGVFGTSDQVLGTIESGIDFEKRIAQIYQQCRTTEQIENAFRKLQEELEPSINQAMQHARKQLLENFDQEVTKKLRLNLQKIQKHLTQQEKWLWLLTQFALSPYATFNQNNYSFLLQKNPFKKLNIPTGTYAIGKQTNNAYYHYRPAHPLAQQIIQNTKQKRLPQAELSFLYTPKPENQAIAPYVGQSGYMCLHLMTISDLKTEQHLLITAITDKGEIIDNEQAHAFFNLPAIITKKGIDLPQKAISLITKTYDRKCRKIIKQTNQQNKGHLQNEIKKIELWIDEIKQALKIELKKIDQKMNEARKLANIAPNYPNKLKFEKEQKKLQNKKKNAWNEYYQKAEELENKKENIIKNIEKKMIIDHSIEHLFTIKWNVFLIMEN